MTWYEVYLNEKLVKTFDVEYYAREFAKKINGEVRTVTILYGN